MPWIKCSERMPKIKEYVLTFEKDALMPIKSNYIHNYENEFAHGKNISHWMPLPKPPEGE